MTEPTIVVKPDLLLIQWGEETVETMRGDGAIVQIRIKKTARKRHGNR